MPAARDPDHFTECQEGRGIRLVPEKMYVALGPYVTDELLQAGLLWTTADEDQVQVVKQVSEDRKGPNGILKPLVWNKRSCTDDQAGVLLDPERAAEIGACSGNCQRRDAGRHLN